MQKSELGRTEHSASTLCTRYSSLIKSHFAFINIGYHMSQLTTDWVRIATEGQTLRNVPIEKQWLIDIAETYDAKKYGARIWPDHRRWYGAWGDVIEVKTEEIDGKLVLFGKLTPNSQFILANESDQKVYTSIEIEPNFAGSGKAYLTGLGVTDEPASLGTDRLKFSVKDRLETHHYGAPEQLVVSYPIVNDKNEKATEAQRLFSKLINLFSTQTPEQAPELQEEEPMDKQQFEALMGKVDGIASKVGELEGKVESFGKNPIEDKPEDKGVKPDDKKPAEVKPDDTGVTSEQFGALTQSITGLAAKVEGMETKFNALSKEAPGQEPNPAGLGETFEVV
jgi:hypothetical protein